MSLMSLIRPSLVPLDWLEEQSRREKRGLVDERSLLEAFDRGRWALLKEQGKRRRHVKAYFRRKPGHTYPTICYGCAGCVTGGNAVRIRHARVCPAIRVLIIRGVPRCLLHADDCGADAALAEACFYVRMVDRLPWLPVVDLRPWEKRNAS